MFVALSGFVDFVGQINDIGTGDYGVNQAIQYTLLKLPSSIFQLMPIIILIGSLLGLGLLSKNRELIVLLSSGLSLQRLGISVFSSGLILCFFTVSLGEYISPSMERYADQYRTISKFQYSSLGNTGGIWLKEGNKIININLLMHGSQIMGFSRFRIIWLITISHLCLTDLWMDMQLRWNRISGIFL